MEEEEEKDTSPGCPGTPLRMFASTEAPDHIRNRGISVSEIEPTLLDTKGDPSEAAFADPKSSVIEFLRNNKGYDVMAERSNLVVLDYNVPLNLAFEAMKYHHVDASPLWDSQNADHIGLLTATDVVYAMYLQAANPSKYPDLQHCTISEWKKLASQNYPIPSKIITCYPEQTLHDITKCYFQHKIHRVPLIDPADHTVVSVINQFDVLNYIINHSDQEVDKLFPMSLQQIEIGNFNQVHCAMLATKMTDVLGTLANEKITGVPVVDEAGIVRDIFSTADVLSCFKTWKEWTENYHRSVQEVLTWANRDPTRITLRVCKLSDTLSNVFKIFVRERLSRLVCVDDEGRAIGIISLSDILGYFLG